MTSLQQKTAQAIVNIFETGRLHGDYGRVVVADGDKGHLSYGRSQTTLASGQLFILLNQYCAADGARFAEQIRPYLTRLANIDLTLDHDLTFRGILNAAGDDPVMQGAQDAFFTQHYFDPARSTAAKWGIETPLGQAVVYDSFIQGSPTTIHDLVVSRIGRIGPSVTEQRWVAEWLECRKAWLLQKGGLLAKTIYRMEEFKDLMQQGPDKWDLTLPFRVRGFDLNENALNSLASSPPVVRASATDPPTRILHLANPFLVGDDVRRLQKALADKGFKNGQDGVFGPFTETLVKQFQRSAGLPADGMVGPKTAQDLGLAA
jgi:chitosanase